MSESNTQSNLWLQRLSSEDREAITTKTQPLVLTLGDVLFEQDEWLTDIYFVDTGIISSIIPLSDGRALEAYMVGNEGLTGTEASFQPARSINRLTVQGSGSARGIEAEAFRYILAERPAVREALSDYEWSLKAEIEQSTACNAVHMAEPRLAKWLLRCHDRTEGDVVRLTQEFMAAMLGTQRTTVNEAAQSLQRRGAIDYNRAKITVISRRKLEAAACECYSAARATRDARSDDEMADPNSNA